MCSIGVRFGNLNFNLYFTRLFLFRIIVDSECSFNSVIVNLNLVCSLSLSVRRLCGCQFCELFLFSCGSSCVSLILVVSQFALSLVILKLKLRFVRE